jgi:hypothetical protein
VMAGPANKRLELSAGAATAVQVCRLTKRPPQLTRSVIWDAPQSAAACHGRISP